MNRVFKGALAAAALFILPANAQAQAWKEYPYPDARFTIQFPADPAITFGGYTTKAGVTVPAKTYSVRQGDANLVITVADFTATRTDQDTAINDAISTLRATNEVKLDVSERIDRHIGRQLSLIGKDNSRTAAAIFFVENRLIILTGAALPPDPDASSSLTSRFQQSLSFIDKNGDPPQRGGDGAGPRGRRGDPGRPQGADNSGRGRGGLQGPPPPGAFDDCKGKKEGDAVSHATPEGVRAAHCFQTPQGLAARPDTPL